MAMKPSRKKMPAIAVSIPQNPIQVTDYIRQIGQLQRDTQRVQAAMNDELAAVRERYETEAQPLIQRADALTEGLHTWCEANRDKLTQGGKVKTAAFPSGEVSWRIRPPSVRVTGADAVLDALRKFGLNRFVRTKDEVNKEAILNEPEAVAHVPGISISQGEDFIVTPFEVELSEQAA